VNQDYAEAVAWFRKAADQGDAEAQRNLGIMYDGGQGVAQSYSQADMWYRKSAERGNADAQLDLGLRYIVGQGVVVDGVQAIGWFRKAAEQGNVGAQFNLGEMYIRGRGISRDYAEGYCWVDIAMAGNVKSDSQDTREAMGKALEEASSHLSGTVMSQTQERARKWSEDHAAIQNQK
jgi:TPR repeat protein